jgi:hypothetical protein
MNDKKEGKEGEEDVKVKTELFQCSLNACTAQKTITLQKVTSS